MENKQDVVLNLMMEMLRLMFKLTFVLRNNEADETDDLIRYVRNKLDEFENVFIKKEEAENEKQ
mgnify:CR=1 FL=1